MPVLMNPIEIMDYVLAYSYVIPCFLPLPLISLTFHDICASNLASTPNSEYIQNLVVSTLAVLPLRPDLDKGQLSY